MTRALVAILAASFLGCGPAPAGKSFNENNRSSGVSAASTHDADISGSSLQLIVEPGDGGAGLVNAINGAKTYVHMTMYELSAASIISALTGRAAAGVEVKVILDSSSTTASLNKKSYATLQAAGVDVVWSSTEFTYTHEKCVVIDDNVAWIMTMNSANSSLTQNREYLAIDTSAADIAEAEAQFEADFTGTEYAPNGPLLMSPVSSRPGIEALINNAAKTLDFEVEEITDTTVVSDFCAAVKRGVTVRGCLAAGTESATEQSAVAQLKSCGVSLVTLKVPYIHAKAIAADASTVYIGSENFSATSLDKNRELGLVTSDSAFVSTVAATVSKDIGAGTAL